VVIISLAVTCLILLPALRSKNMTAAVGGGGHFILIAGMQRDKREVFLHSKIAAARFLREVIKQNLI
jgi:hypothetical protein